MLFNDPATTEIYTLSLHDALPIFQRLLKIAAVRGAFVDADTVRFRTLGGAAVAGDLRGGDGQAEGQGTTGDDRSEEHTSELQSRQYLVCRLLLERKTYRR